MCISCVFRVDHIDMEPCDVEVPEEFPSDPPLLGSPAVLRNILKMYGSKPKQSWDKCIRRRETIADN